MVKTTKGLSALTHDQVRQIRAEYRAKRYGTRRVTQQSLAETYGVSQQAISDILSGKTYKDVN